MKRVGAAGLVLAWVLWLAAPVGVGAQEAGPEGADAVVISSVDDSAHPEVTLTVSLPERVSTTDLSTAFAVTENGRAAPASATKLGATDLEVVLVLDTSGSMKGQPIVAARAAARTFVERMPAGVQIAVIGFGETAEVRTEFTTDRFAAIDAIDGLQTDGETALYDGLVTGAGQFDGRAESRRFVILLSDGGDTASTSTSTEAATALAASGADVVAVALETAEFDGAVLADVVGSGRVVSADDPGSLAEVYDEIAGELLNQYEVTYTSGSSGTTPIVVEVIADDGVLRTETEILLPDLEESSRSVATVTTTTAPIVLPAAPVALTRETPLVGQPFLYVGTAAFFASLLVGALVVFTPRSPRRMLSSAAAKKPFSAESLHSASQWVDRALETKGRRAGISATLEAAGLPLRAGEAVMAIAGFAVAAFFVGALFGGILLGLVGLVVASVGSWLVLRYLADKRRRLFGEQLPNTLQLLAGSLRSGYSILQAVEAVASEADAPTSEEFSRAIREAQLGRDLTESMTALAHRVGSDDFVWVARAIDIHREVGGDLGEVLDNVSETIRSRASLQRTVRALSAEGRLSGIVLFVMPFVMGGLLLVLNRSYTEVLYQTGVGRVLLTVGLTLMCVGGLWMRQLAKPRF